MSNEIGTPPQKRGMGCFGKGCTTLAGLLVFLAIALIAGTFWGIHYLRGFSAPDPLPLPKVDATTTSAALDAPTPEPTFAPAPAPSLPAATPEAAALSSIPAPAVRNIPVASDWKSFQRAAKRGEAVAIELSAADINGLIAGSDDARGKVFVGINNDVGHVQISLPLDKVPFMNGRYLNGELSVASSPDGDPAKVRVSDIILNGQPVSNAFLDRSLFGYPSLRTVVGNWLNQQRISTFRIENNRAIGESSGSR